MPITTAAPRKPAASPNGSHRERKDDARVIVRPPVYEKGIWSPRWACTNRSISPTGPFASDDYPATSEQCVTRSTFAPGSRGRTAKAAGLSWKVRPERPVWRSQRQDRTNRQSSDHGGSHRNGKPRWEPGPTLKLLPTIFPRWASREEQACGYEGRYDVTALQQNYFFARLV